MQTVELTKAMEVGSFRIINILKHHHTLLIAITVAVTLQCSNEDSWLRNHLRDTRQYAVAELVNWSINLDGEDIVIPSSKKTKK